MASDFANNLIAGIGVLTPTGCTVHVQHPTAGAVTLSTGQSVVVDPNVNGGNAQIVLTGVADGTSCIATHSNGDAWPLTLRTAPASTDQFTVAWCGCHVMDKPAWWAKRMLDLGVRAVLLPGDLGYSAYSYTANGVSYLGPADGGTTDAVDAVNAHRYHQSFQRMPMFRRLFAAAGVYASADDHEWWGDNWDHSLVHANDGLSIFTTQADVDAHFAVYRQAMQNSWPTPQGTFPTAVAQKPSGADAATPASNYPPMYYKFTLGPCEFFVGQCIPHRNYIADTNDSSKHMWGTEQTAQMLAAVQASTATFKVIVNDKNWYLSPNGDSWFFYREDRTQFFAGLTGITGLFTVTADMHHPHVCQATSGVPVPMWEFCHCPGNAVDGTGPKYHTKIAGYNMPSPDPLKDDGVNGARYWAAGYPAAQRPNYNAFGRLEFHGSDYVDIIGEDHLGHQYSRYRWYAGATAPVGIPR